MIPQTQPSDNRIRNFDFELEQLLMQLVLRDHPDWDNAAGAGFEAWLETQRLLAEADRVELLSN